MDLDRGALANLDRRLLAGLDREERFQMVRVPVSPAKWSTWKRYCATVGVSMGRAIMALIERELASLEETAVDDYPALAQRARERLASREAEVAGREQAMASAEERIRSRSEHLRRWRPSFRHWRSESSWHRNWPHSVGTTAQRSVATSGARAGRD